MAYADYTFYKDVFYGDTLTEDNADKWLDRASDEIDAVTFRRLASAFPTEEVHAVKVRKAVCAVAEALFLIDGQQKAVSAHMAEDGSYRGMVSSITSGKESISFASPGNSANASVYAAAAANDNAKRNLLNGTIATYLSNIPDAEGTNLLYAGGDRYVQ